MQHHDHSHEQENPIVVSDDNIAKVNVSVEEHELEAFKKYYIKEKRKHVVLNGFRKGTVPEEMVAKVFSAEARQSAKNSAIYTKFMKLLNEHKLQALTDPKISHMHDKDGKIHATLLVDVLQPIILGQYLGLEVKKMPEKSFDETVNNTLSEIRQTYPKLADTESDFIRDKNIVIADFTMSSDGKELEKQSDFKLNIGVSLYFKPFEEKLIGMKIGESKEFDIEFPETYYKEDFRNKLIHFSVHIKDIKDTVEYSDSELAEVLKYENKENMFNSIRQQIENKFNEDAHTFYENQILAQLLSVHQFKIPQKLLDDEIKKINNDRPEMSVQDINEMADRFVRTDLVLHAIYERHPEIQLTQEQFNAKVNDLALRANDSIENTMQKLQTANKLQSFVNYLANCKVIDFLIEMSDKKIN